MQSLSVAGKTKCRENRSLRARKNGTIPLRASIQSFHYTVCITKNSPFFPAGIFFGQKIERRVSGFLPLLQQAVIYTIQLSRGTQDYIRNTCKKSLRFIAEFTSGFFFLRVRRKSILLRVPEASSNAHYYAADKLIRFLKVIHLLSYVYSCS